jgi:beta-barrel assembly-enhancing protease
MGFESNYDRGGGRSSLGGTLLSMLFRNPRILGALAVIIIGVFTYYTQTQMVHNPVTGREVRVIKTLTPEQEVALGLQSVPEMARQFGGEIADPSHRQRVNRIGARLVTAKDEILKRRGIEDYPYPFQFHLLADNRTINAFALPGGQIFITAALYRQLPSEDAVAGVLGHEIGHVVARHSNQQMAKNKLLQSYAQAAAVATSDGYGSGSAVGQMVNQFLQTRYSREDELEADRLGVQLLAVAGYEMEAILEVMRVLQSSMKGARGPEMLSTHPYPEARTAAIKEYIPFFKRDPYAIWKN